MSRPTRQREAGIAFNGKFLTARPTGVHRVALELLRAIDGQAATEHASGGAAAEAPLRLLLPRGDTAVPGFSCIEVVRAGRLGGQLWEQWELSRLAADDLVVSLCNIGPVTTSRAVTLIHDAQVYLTPGSYDRAFLLKYRLLLPLIGRRHCRIVTVSAYSREQLAAHGVAPPERISVVHNGVDHILRTPAEPDVLQELGLVPGSFVVALANTQQHKNIGLLLRAFATEPLRETTLLLVGAADRAAFEAAGHTVPANARFAGVVSDGGLRALMEAALCLAFPSTTEGFGLPPLEAMLVGCPAIVAPCGALPEVCGDAALYCAPDDPGAWVAAIQRLRDQPLERAARIRQGEAHAGRYTWSEAGRQMLTILRQVAVECGQNERSRDALMPDDHA